MGALSRERRKRGGERAAHLVHIRNALPLKVAREKERKSENIHRGLHKRNCFPKPLTGKKERFKSPQVFLFLFFVFINGGAQSMKFQRSAPGAALARKQGEAPGVGSMV